MGSEDSDLNLDEMCGICFKDFEDCMCCSCGDENGEQFKEGIMCKECHDSEYGKET